MSGRPGTPDTPFTRPPRGGPSERQRRDASALASYCCAKTDDGTTATNTEATHSAASTRTVTCRMLGIEGFSLSDQFLFDEGYTKGKDFIHEDTRSVTKKNTRKFVSSPEARVFFFRVGSCVFVDKFL